MKRKLKVNDFFCGCGGMGIAFKNAGYEIAGAWDFDKYAVESYRANVGDHVQKADIKELHQADIPQADVWAFGFPCQDLSVAGKQRGMILKCEDCGEEIEINPEEYTGNTICPKCSSNNFKAASRSGCFFEMMRLLEETEREREHAMPAVIIAENVRGLRPYLPVLRLEYERHGYTAHIEMFNSKYWNVPQNRERYAVVGTRNKKNLTFTFPKEQHEFVPKLSDYLEKDVPEKNYLPDEKAQTIIAQALEKLEGLGKCHACITPDRINKRQNGPRAKAEDEPMFTLTAQDLHGVIILEDEQTEESVVTDIAEETGLLDPNGCGKTLRVGGAEVSQRNITTNTLLSIQGGQRATEFPITVTVNKCGRNVLKIADVSPCLTARDYKGYAGKKDMIAVIEERKEQDNGKSQQPGLPNGGMLDIKGQDQCRRVYSTDGIAPTLTTSGGGQREVKIFDTKRLRVRKLTPKEYGILQAFPMDDWKQVVSDSQAYKQFGNAVTTTVFTAIAEEIAKSIYAAEESEEQNMEAENKNFTGMNEPEEKPTAESILAAAEAEAKVAAEREETTKTAIPAEETITPNSLANGMLQFLLDSGIVASACVTDETEKMFAKHIKEELDGITIGETPEILRDWEAAQNAVNDMLSKYAPGGYMGKIIYPLLTPLKERLEAGERTPDLYNAIVEATR